MTPRDHEREFMAMLRSVEGTITRVCLYFAGRDTEVFKELYDWIVSELWRSYPYFQRTSGVNTWVYRLAVNTAMRHMRRRYRRPHLVAFSPRLADSLADTQQDELVTRLYELIGCLPADDQKLLFLYLDKVPLRNIAEVMHTNENTVKQRLKRLKHKLKIMNENED
ncbi:MAG: sigma-70 family RNA polymerase sigma factor [Bacteroidales bacterium]|nr:sigma-70 family RNA polymerase sigma factor [Bacteroidales bacterium]